MNQHRWTCLTTVVLTTVIAPIATVHAKTLPSLAVGSGDKYIPLSPQSLPKVTPLVVTELETDAVVPTAIKPVPQVSTLPIVRRIARQPQLPATRAKQQQPHRTSSIPATKLQSKYVVSPQPAIPSFNPTTQITQSILSIPSRIDSSAAPVNAVAPLPTRIVAQPQPIQSPIPFAGHAASAPILVVRGHNAPKTVISNSATAQAEIAHIPQAPATSIDPTPTKTATVIDTAIERAEIPAIPQSAPIIVRNDDRADKPSFESGLPVFVFDNERTQQIVATAIAQVGNEIVAPEPSIAIPVERPKQMTIPTQTPLPQSIIPATPAPVPTVPAIVKIEQPAETTQPALEKIVATYVGKASWYGSEGGSRTANGERYNPNGLTAAHRTLPFGTKVRVTSLKTGKSVIVRINDRGPFHGNRIVDISAGAAAAIGIKSDGIGKVRMEVLASEG